MTTRNDRAPRFCIDGGFLLALLIGTIAAWPFFAYASLPTATDAELHIFRIAEIGYSLRAGNLYPRWAANFYHGYGYPIFNYYSPLTYHLGNWLTLFHPERAVAGAKALFIGAALLGAAGAYLLGREFGHEGGGVLGAAAFAFSPYIMLINPHGRGDLAEVFALALVPWVLWSWEGLWNGGGKAIFALAVVSAAATILSHNLTGLTTMVLVVALSVWQWVINKRSKRFGLASLAGILTIALTAYFWMPFLLERQYVYLKVAGNGHYDFRHHFVLLKELLAPLRPLDWRAATINPPMTAGPLSLCFAIGGILVALWQRQPGQFRRLLFYVLSSLCCLWLVTPYSRFLWELMPGMQFYQFPWRFLGPLAALLVPLVASLGNIILPKKAYTALLIGFLALLLLTALPGLYPIPWATDFGPVTPLSLLDLELQGRWRGTTSTNDFVPATVTMIPGPQQSLLDSYRHPPVDRVNRYTIPADATVTVLTDVPWRNTFTVHTAKKFLLRLYLFYFPGWKAYVDEQEVPIEIANPEGFITVWVPAGDHQVSLCFEDTMPRTLGWIIAGIGLVAFLWSLWRLPRASAVPQTPFHGDKATLTWMAVCLGCGILLKGLVFDPAGWFHYTSPLGEVRAAQYRQKADFGGEIALLGFDLSSTHLEPGDILDVSLYWNAERPMTETYQSFVHLVYPEGQIWTQSDHLNPAGFPTNLWPTDRYIKDSHRLILPSDLPAGEYAISVGIYTLRNNRRLPVCQADAGARVDNVILNQTMTVRK
ncbi:MAG TPA: 6-pyruvoyl-tetrahydropterin synthase-related protein [Anaerolineae bacterium]|nr:6-pyruvoyl-tetrahydropterin synthase-related protein [Anaerolineae bacterium]